MPGLMKSEQSQLKRHIEKHIGAIHTVFQEIVSDDLHIDIIHVKSTLFRRYEVLITSGMSAKPMAVPSESAEACLAEVMVLLPKGWPLSPRDFSDERNYWPIRLLKTFARYTHHSNIWIGYGHTLANGESESSTLPFAEGTSLCAAILLPSFSLGLDACSFKRPDGQEVFLWAAIPLHMNELKFKIERGVDPLMDLFDLRGITDRVEPTRPCALQAPVGN
jgi:hypothetical protein